MGAPLAFEYRRQELREQGLPCTDADVVQSYTGRIHTAIICDEFMFYGKLA